MEFAPYYSESNQLKAATTVRTEHRWLCFDIDESLVGRRGEQSDNPPQDLAVCRLEQIIIDKQGMSDSARGVIHSLMLHS